MPGTETAPFLRSSVKSAKPATFSAAVAAFVPLAPPVSAVFAAAAGFVWRCRGREKTRARAREKRETSSHGVRHHSQWVLGAAGTLTAAGAARVGVVLAAGEGADGEQSSRGRSLVGV